MFLFTEKYVILVIPFVLFVLTVIFFLQERYDRKKYEKYIEEQKLLSKSPTSAKVIKFENRRKK